MTEHFSYAPSFTAPPTDTLWTVEQFADLIRDGAFQRPIEQVRAGNRSKSDLPVWLMSGQFEGDKDKASLVKPSGLIVMDLDKLGDKAAEMRDLHKKTPTCVLAALSASGQGVFAVHRYELANHDILQTSDIDEIKVGIDGHHKRVFDYLNKVHYRDEADKQCSNVNRLRYASWDPDLYYNPEAVRVTLADLKAFEATTTNSTPSHTPSGPVTGQTGVPESVALLLRQGAPEGDRNRTCMFIACQLRDEGWSQLDAEAQLLDWAGRCNPVYPPPEVRGVVRSVFSTPARVPASGQGEPLTQVEPADLDEVDWNPHTLSELINYEHVDDPNAIFVHGAGRGEVSTIIAGQNQGKSTLAAQIALEASRGIQGGPMPTKMPVSVAMVQAENPVSVFAKHIQGVCKGLGWEGEPLNPDNPRFISSSASGDQWVARLIRELDDMEKPPDVLICDNIFSFFRGDANDSKEVSAFLRGQIDPLAKRYNMHIIMIAHTAKGCHTIKKLEELKAHAAHGSAEYGNHPRWSFGLALNESTGLYELICLKFQGEVGGDWGLPAGKTLFRKHLLRSNNMDEPYWRVK